MIRGHRTRFVQVINHCPVTGEERVTRVAEDLASGVLFYYCDSCETMHRNRDQTYGTAPAVDETPIAW